ncbi:hypothetical protein J6590_074227 [Homalodisca vitripennis]|nr:hypothetical protein J6590_074227 [Homalodisca vitripennis]
MEGFHELIGLMMTDVIMMDNNVVLEIITAVLSLCDLSEHRGVDIKMIGIHCDSTTLEAWSTAAFSC